GADVDIANGSGVVAPGGAEEELAQVHGAAGNVAADEVGVHCFQCGGSENAAGEDAIAEARCEALDLQFESFKHVDRGTVGNVAVSPSDVLPCRGTGGVEEAGV